MSGMRERCHDPRPHHPGVDIVGQHLEAPGELRHGLRAHRQGVLCLGALRLVSPSQDAHVRGATCSACDRRTLAASARRLATAT